MKVEISEGCTAFYTTIDGKPIEEVDKNQLLDYLLVKLKESVNRGEVSIDDIIKLFQYDDYETDSRPCEQCGDSVSRTFWNI